MAATTSAEETARSGAAPPAAHEERRYERHYETHWRMNPVSRAVFDRCSAAAEQALEGRTGLVALDELVVHGWDLAVSTGQAYAADPVAVEACAEWVAGFAPPADGPDAPADEGGLFGRPVPVGADASALDRLLGLTGRDPAWRPGPR